MFKVGDKYKLVEPDHALMNDTPEGTVLTIESTQSGGTIAQISGSLGPQSAREIDEVDVKEGHVVKTTSVGGLHMDVTLDTTSTTNVKEILCRAAEQIHEKTGVRIEEVDFHWQDGSYIHSIHIEGGV